jgi:N-acetylneuraminic acid mutarotase
MYDVVNDSWLPRADYPGTPAYTTIGFVLDSIAYVGIGYGPYTNEIWAYNPGLNSWTQKAPFPQPYRQTCVAFVDNSIAYAGLGGTSGGGFSDFYQYDAAMDAWNFIGNFLGGGRWGSSVLTLDGEVYVGTGYGSIPYSSFYKFDPSNNSWTLTTAFGGGLRRMATPLTIGNRAFLGMGNGAIYHNDLWEMVNVVSVNEAKSEEVVMIYPNPVGSILNFAYDVSKLATIQMFSFNGQVAEWNAFQNNTIELPQVADGIYQLRFITKSGDQFLSKIAVSQ